MQPTPIAAGGAKKLSKAATAMAAIPHFRDGGVVDYYDVADVPKKPGPHKRLTPMSIKYGENDTPAAEEIQYGANDVVDTPPKPRGAIAEIANQGYAGVVSDLPQMVGRAVQYASDPGKPVYEWGKGVADAAEKRGKAPDLQPDPQNHNMVTNALASGARMIPRSLAPAAVVGGGIAALPFGVPAAVAIGTGALVGSIPAALSQGQETLNKAKEAGVPDDIAIPAARKTAAIEGLGETVGTIAGAKVLGLGGKAISTTLNRALGRSGGTAAGNVLEEATSRAVLKPWAKQVPEAVIGEVGTEMAQNAGEAYVEQQAGIDQQTPWDTAKEAIAPTLGMTALLAPFGLVGHGVQARANGRRAAALSSVDSPAELRMAAAEQIQNHLAAVDPVAAQNFGAHAAQAIEGNRPLVLGDHLFTVPASPAAEIGPDVGGSVGDGQGGTPPIAPNLVSDTLATEAVPTSAAMGIAPDAGVLSRVAATAVDTGITQANEEAQAAYHAEQEATLANAADQAAYDQSVVEQDRLAAEQEKQAAQFDTSTNPITSGPIAEAQMAPEDRHAVLYSNQPVADGGVQYEGTQDGDILNGMGAPFATRFAAARRAKMEGAGWTIAPVFDGFVARRKDAALVAGESVNTDNGAHAPASSPAAVPVTLAAATVAPTPTSKRNRIKEAREAYMAAHADQAMTNNDQTVTINTGSAPDGVLPYQPSNDVQSFKAAPVSGEAPENLGGVSTASPVKLPATGAADLSADVGFVSKSQQKVTKKSSPAPSMRADDVNRVVKAVNRRITSSGAHVSSFERFEDLPHEVQAAAQKAGVPNGDFRGVTMPKGQVFIVHGNHSNVADVEATILHEVYGHVGMRLLFGPDLHKRLNKLYLSLGERRIQELATKYGLTANQYQGMADKLQGTVEQVGRAGGRQALRNGWFVEELLAHIAEQETGTIKQRALELIGAIRTWLRMHGFATLAKMNMADIAHVLKRGRLAAETATGFEGVADAPMFSRSAANDFGDKATGIIGATHRQYSAEQMQAMRNVGFQVEGPTLKERAQTLWQDAGKKLAQGMVDQFAPVKELDQKAYGLLRLSKGATGAFETVLMGGKLKLTDGVYDFDDSSRGGVVEKLLTPLQGEHHDFLRWVAANRAERLTNEGKEHLFTPEDIRALKSLQDGNVGFDYTIQNGVRKGRVVRDRATIYRDSLVTFNGFNKNILDMAEQSGLIDSESRTLWENEFYVPFFRVADDGDGGVRGMNIGKGMVRQQAFKALKGGKNALKADLLENTLMNWAHLLEAGAKNRAAKATLEAAERMGVAISAPQGTVSQMGKAAGGASRPVWFMDDGIKHHYLVDDPYLMTALSALEYAGMRNPVMNAMGMFKHALTIGVTASPFFKVRNLIRDSVQVIGTSPIGINPVKNIADGWKLTNPKSDSYFKLLAGGGTIHFGTMLEGSEAKRVQALVESGVDASTILDSDHKVKAFYRKFIEPGVTAYNELGNRGEAINRAALYDQLVKQGVSHADASLQARDLMDFSMSGSFTSVRFLAQVVPFFNARIQGLYKLGKSAKEDPARFSAVLGATALFSLALLAAYGDDDDWKKRTDTDRNNFWWFKFGDTAFRIPKPFEIGAMATLAERGFELMTDNEMTGKRFRSQVLALLADNLAMNPMPQMFKPMLEVYANKDSFTGMPIESMGMDRLKPDHRFNDRTSMTARAVSTAANAVTNLAGIDSPSPVQVDHMMRGYFGWLGAFAVGMGDLLARPLTDQPAQATPDYWKAVTGNMVSDMQDAPSRYVTQMYAQAKEIEQSYGTWRALLKNGKTQEAAEFRQDNHEDLVKYHAVETVKRTESRLNERLRFIERSDMDSDTKREEVRKVNHLKDAAARRIAANP